MTDHPPEATASSTAPTPKLSCVVLAFVGKLASMPKREASVLARNHGAEVVEAPHPELNLLVIGEGQLPPDDAAQQLLADEAIRQHCEIIHETDLWQRLGLLDGEQNVHRLYTPAILADLLKVPVAVIRRWHRRGLIVPVREVRRLAYFDFQEVAAARHLAALLDAGVKPKEIERKLEELSRFVPHVKRPLAQLSVIVSGKELLLRHGDGLLATGGQRWFDFDVPETNQLSVPANDSDAGPASIRLPEVLATLPESMDPEAMLDAAAELEEAGQLDAAAEMLRAVLAASGPKPDVCFLLAELLYRQGDLTAARERYYMAIELDENYVEARANLGCVLQELGNHELAVAAFEGALAYHGEYPDAHYHLARLLDEMEQPDAAQPHWLAFLELVPESPWAVEAYQRLENAAAAAASPDAADF